VIYSPDGAINELRNLIE